MRIEIWSDVVCPWCYIGKRRLERAVEVSGIPADQLEIVWHSFQLDPSAPRVPVETVAESLGRKYGGGAESGLAMVERVEAVAAEEGMTWRHRESLRVSTVDAHRLLHLALETGGPELQGRLKEALLAAYFERVANVADADTLTRIAGEVGLDTDRVREVLAGDEYAAAVDRDTAEAVALGATGVPFYVIDRKYGIPGAQPVDTFVQVLERAWSDAHPKLDLVPANRGGGESCGPDGCAV
jgi:predicted DsbA family dithiol-disulfide isomerase